MNSELEKKLLATKNDRRADFTYRCVPTFPRERILGATAREIGAIAREYAKTDFRPFLREKHFYLEEFSLHGALLGYAKNLSLTELTKEIESFLPQIDNWAVCDSTVAGLKIIRKNRPFFLEKIKKWLESDHVYTIRFAVVTLLSYYLDDGFDPAFNDRLATFQTNEYYINMAIAWYYSVALVKQYDATLPLFLENRIVNPWVHDKAIQKARESYRVSAEKKAFLNTLKRNRRSSVDSNINL